MVKVRFSPSNGISQNNLIKYFPQYLFCVQGMYSMCITSKNSIIAYFSYYLPELFQHTVPASLCWCKNYNFNVSLNFITPKLFIHKEGAWIMQNCLKYVHHCHLPPDQYYSPTFTMQFHRKNVMWV